MNKLRDTYAVGGFLHFFHGTFQDRLEAIEIPEMDNPSWDRRAAYLLWLAEGGSPNTDAESQMRKALPKRAKAIPAPDPDPEPETEQEDLWGGLV